MKKGMNLAAKVGLICCLTGTLLCVVGLIGDANPGVVFNSDTLDIEYDGGYLEVESDFMHDLYTAKMEVERPLDVFQNIVVETEICRLNITKGAEYAIFVEDSKYDFDDEAIQYEVKDGTLYVTELVNEDYMGIHEKLRKVKITFPMDAELDTVTVKQGSGILDVYGITGKHLDVSGSTNEIDLRGLNLDSLHVESESGIIHGGAVHVASKTEITNRMGDTEFQGDLLGEVHLNNGTGIMEIRYMTSKDDYYTVIESNEGILTTVTTGMGQSKPGHPYKPIEPPVNDPNAPNKEYINNGTGEIHFT